VRRLLSQALIIILLLLGPISFTTANIPNFQPDCETGRYLSIKTTLTVAVVSQSPQATTRALPESPPPQHIFFAALHPSNRDLFFPSCYSRPPPRC